MSEIAPTVQNMYTVCFSDLTSVVNRVPETTISSVKVYKYLRFVAPVDVTTMQRAACMILRTFSQFIWQS